MAQATEWDCFDRIYCITLESRPDRLAAARRQFAAVGLEGRVEYFQARKDTAKPARGIFHSHMHCLRQGLAQGAERILVFEDDVLFHRFDSEQLRRAGSFLQRDQDWHAFFLGCLTTASRPTDEAAVVRIHYRCLCHAYALNRNFAERLVAHQWQNIPFDNLLMRTVGHSFALSPMCAFQGHARSDNQTVWIDRLRTLFGGLYLIQRGNELFQNHKGSILLLHLLLAAALLFSLLLVA